MGCYKDNMKPMEVRQQEFLLWELNRVESKKINELRKQFGLEDDSAPCSFSEFVKRITDGKFVFPEDRKDQEMGTYSLMDYIEWRDPAVKKDQAGFDTAYEAFETAKHTTQQDIMVKPAADGLSSLRTLEGWAYTAPTTTTVQ